MNDGLNLVILSGNLGNDPELKHTDAAGAVLKLRVATTRSWVDKEEKKHDYTDWHNVTVFGPRADRLAKVLSKGKGVTVKGRLQTSTYEKNGEKRYWTEVIAEELNYSDREPRTNGAPRTPDLAVSAGDLPF